MELIIGVIAIAVVGYFVFFRKKEEVVSPAPYKVEVSQQDIVTGLTVAPAPAPVVEEVKVEESAPVVEAPAKATRKPRTPKAEKPAKKPAAKKAAPKKVAAIKATKKSKNA